MRFHAPYLEWAKKRKSPRFDLAGSNILGCSIDDIEGARDALNLSGHNDDGYGPLVEAIADRYRVSPEWVATANGAAGANFQVCAALLEPGDDVLVERPGYDPLLGAPRMLGANVIRFDRHFEDAYALDPDRVARVLTQRTRLIIVSSPHNPTGAKADRTALAEVGQIARSVGARVLVDQVYLDAAGSDLEPAVSMDDVFVSTSSLTKSYGLSGLRCGWSLSSPDLAERIRRARDIVDGNGSIVAERLATLAFSQLERLTARANALLTANGALVREFFLAHPELEVAVHERATVAFPRIRGVDDTSRFADRLLAEHETAIVPGRFFEAPRHFRLGFGGPTETVRSGLAALGAALDARKW
jgi:aspartate/methionine/tyrosine aminotransferase